MTLQTLLGAPVRSMGRGRVLTPGHTSGAEVGGHVKRRKWLSFWGAMLENEGDASAKVQDQATLLPQTLL